MKRRVTQRTAALIISMMCLCTFVLAPSQYVDAQELTDLSGDSAVIEEVTDISASADVSEELTPLSENEADNADSQVSEELTDISTESFKSEDLTDIQADEPGKEDPSFTFNSNSEQGDTADTFTDASAADVHYLAFAADRHGTTTAIKASMSGMPSDVEYVGLLGDMVGSPAVYAPKYKSSKIVNEVNKIGFKRKFNKSNTTMLWGSHDKNVNDDAKIVFANGGDGSGLMYTGKDNSGNPVYYVYGIAFNDMMDMNKAMSASKVFEKWVDTVKDRSIPIIVCCHVPIHYARGDNGGAPFWNLALNYAATGYETTEATAVVSRNVIFFFGHNHAVDGDGGENSGELFVPCESEMEIGAMENVCSRIFYTYTTAGYLKKNTSSTLVVIEPKEIRLEKYEDGYITNDLYEKTSAASGKFSNRFVKKGINRINRVSPNAKVKKISTKACNPLIVEKKDVSVKYSDLKKKNQSISSSRIVTVRNVKGTLKYKKLKGNKKITVDSKTGNIRVGKGLSKGTYYVRYRVTASGSAHYKAGSKTVNIILKVK